MGGMRDRLLREAQALARLSHPNVIAVHDVGTFGQDVFIAMEFVEGATLRAWLKSAPRNHREVLDAFLAAGHGLAAAHRAGLVHRDFKPDNVMVGSDGRVRVLDFGLARDATTNPVPADGDLLSGPPTSRSPGSTTAVTEPLPPPSSGVPASTPSLDVPLTRYGTILGTPRYMAPEQHLGELADARADQFSFCVALYAALYGEFPFDAKETDALKEQVLQGRVREPPAGSHVPRRLRQLLLRGLSVEPGSRHESMDALLTQLVPVRRDRSPWLTAGALVLALALVGSSLVLWRARAAERAQLCQGGPQRLAGVWDEAARARVRSALLATGEPYAQDAWTNVEKTLDRYAGRWAQMHRDTCEATRLRGEQTDAVMTLRMACLDRKLLGLSALANVLASADSAVLQKAGAATSGLSSIEECSDTAGLLAEGDLPGDPALRKRIGDLRDALSRAEALRLAGRVPAAVELAGRTVTDARTTGNDAILAEALLEEGRGRDHLEPERAANLLAEAFRAAFASRRDRVAVAAATGATRGFALSQHPDDAVLWDQLAQSGLQRMGGDDELEAELWSARAARAIELRRYDDELEAASRAARLSERRFGLDDLRTLEKQEEELNAISDVSRPYESWQRRLSLFERQEQQLGPKHPVVADALMDLGDDEVNLGHLTEARAHLDRSEALLRERGATGSVGWTTLRCYEARLADAEGRRTDLDALGRETLATLERTGRAYSSMALHLQRMLAVNDARLGRGGDAVELLARLMQAAQGRYGQDYRLTYFHAALAKVHLLMGDLAVAREEIDGAAASAVASSGEGSFAVAEIRLTLERVLTAQGHPEQALSLVDSDEPVLVHALGERAPAVAAARRNRGEALAALGRRDAAAAALRASLAIADEDGLDPVQREETRAALARVLATP
jgi:eukaryotic-like serine/threonine-protein kinase